MIKVRGPTTRQTIIAYYTYYVALGIVKRYQFRKTLEVTTQMNKNNLLFIAIGIITLVKKYLTAIGVFLAVSDYCRIFSLTYRCSAR